MDEPRLAVPGAEGSPLPQGGARVHGWQQYLDAAAAESFGAQPGLLAEALARKGVCSTAVGPGAAVMLARNDGTVARYAPSLSRGVDPDQRGDAADARELLADPVCPLTVVDVGALRDPTDPPLGTTAGLGATRPIPPPTARCSCAGSTTAWGSSSVRCRRTPTSS